MGEAKRKKEQFRAFGSCVYCGLACNPTRDHVPPKCIFPKPRPSNLISVPACEDCNQKAGQVDDEMFKAAIALQVKQRKSVENKKFVESALRTLENNRRLRDTLLGGRKPTWVRNDNNELVETSKYLWPGNNHDAVVGRTTQGLYYHHTRDSLFNLGCELEVYFFERGDSDVVEMAQSLQMRAVGNRQFTYAFAIPIEDPRRTLWLYEFYEAHYAGAATFPIGESFESSSPREDNSSKQ